MRNILIIVAFIAVLALFPRTTNAQYDFELRLNMGQTTDYTTGNGAFWNACGNNTTCSGYLSGTGMSGNNGNTLNGPAIPSPNVDSFVMATWRQAATGASPGTIPWSLNIPLDNGYYDVRLYFADFTSTASGQRIFDLLLDDVVVLQNIDLFAIAGFRAPVDLSYFSYPVTDGNLTIQLRVGSAGLPLINAIEIIEVAPPSPTPTPIPTLGPGQCVVIDEAFDRYEIDAGYVVTLLSGSSVELNGPSVITLESPNDSVTIETGGLWDILSAGPYTLEICNSPIPTATPTATATNIPEETATPIPIITPTAIFLPIIDHTNTLSNTQLIFADFVSSGTDDRLYVVMSVMSIVVGFFMARFIKWVIWFRGE